MNKEGFTLIELLVVIAVIALLSVVVFTTLDNARMHARDTQRWNDIAQIQKALELYHLDTGAYPTMNWRCDYDNNWQTSELAIALEQYLPTLPVDPSGEGGGEDIYDFLYLRNYCYFSSGYNGTKDPGSWYMINFKLEKQNIEQDEAHYSKACNGTNTFQYGGSTDGYVMTVGGSCVQ